MSSLSKTGFELTDGLIIPSPVIFLNGTVFLWDVLPPAEDGSWEGWSEEKLKLFEVVTPRPGPFDRSSDPHSRSSQRFSSWVLDRADCSPLPRSKST